MTSTTAHAQRYMRLMAHLPLLQLESPRRALVICFGVGNSLHAASLHPLQKLDVVDLDADVLRQAPLFAHANHDVLLDPRVRVVVDDGRRWLGRAADGYYDFITLEPPPIATAGAAALYSRELYRIARRRLRAGGALSQWLPAYQVPAGAVRSLVAAFLDVFPEATLHVGDGRELFLVGWKGPTPPLDRRRMQRRLAERPLVARDLARHGVVDADDLALTFAADKGTLGRISAGVTPLHDDRPTLEYAQVSHIMETRLPAGLLEPARLPLWCPDCAHDERLMEAAEVLSRVLQSEVYQRFSNLVDPRTTSVLPLRMGTSEAATVARRASLRWLVRALPNE